MSIDHQNKLNISYWQKFRISLPTRMPDWNNALRERVGLVSLSSYIGELIVMVKSMTAAITAKMTVNTEN